MVDLVEIEAERTFEITLPSQLGNIVNVVLSLLFAPISKARFIVRVDLGGDLLSGCAQQPVQILMLIYKAQGRCGRRQSTNQITFDLISRVD